MGLTLYLQVAIVVAIFVTAQARDGQIFSALAKRNTIVSTNQSQYLRCLHCMLPVEHLSECLGVIKCWAASEVCYIQRGVDSNNKTMIKAGCRTKKLCDDTGCYNDSQVAAHQHITQSNETILCSDCCDSEFCNLFSCPESGQPLPTNRCLHCPSVDYPHDCAHTTNCQPDEICVLNRAVTSGFARFDLGCEKRKVCEVGFNSTHNHHRIKRTDPAPGEIVFHSDCCSGHLCNRVDPVQDLSSNATKYVCPQRSTITSTTIITPPTKNNQNITTSTKLMTQSTTSGAYQSVSTPTQQMTTTTIISTMYQNVSTSTQPTYQNISRSAQPTYLNVSTSTQPTYLNVSTSTQPTYQNTSTSTQPTYQKVSTSTQPSYQNLSTSTQQTYQNVSKSTQPTYQKISTSTQPTYQKISTPTKPTYQKISRSTQPTFKNISSTVHVTSTQNKPTQFISIVTPPMKTKNQYLSTTTPRANTTTQQKYKVTTVTMPNQQTPTTPPTKSSVNITSSSPISSASFQPPVVSQQPSTPALLQSQNTSYIYSVPSSVMQLQSSISSSMVSAKSSTQFTSKNPSRHSVYWTSKPSLLPSVKTNLPTLSPTKTISSLLTSSNNYSASAGASYKPQQSVSVQTSVNVPAKSSVPGKSVTSQATALPPLNLIKPSVFLQPSFASQTSEITSLRPSKSLMQMSGIPLSISFKSAMITSLSATKSSSIISTQTSVPLISSSIIPSVQTTPLHYLKSVLNTPTLPSQAISGSSHASILPTPVFSSQASSFSSTKLQSSLSVLTSVPLFSTKIISSVQMTPFQSLKSSMTTQTPIAVTPVYSSQAISSSSLYQRSLISDHASMLSSDNILSLKSSMTTQTPISATPVYSSQAISSSSLHQRSLISDHASMLSSDDILSSLQMTPQSLVSSIPTPVLSSTTSTQSVYLSSPGITPTPNIISPTLSSKVSARTSVLHRPQNVLPIPMQPIG